MKRVGEKDFLQVQEQKKIAKKSDDSSSGALSDGGTSFSSPSTPGERSVKSLLKQKLQQKQSTAEKHGDSSYTARRQLEDWCENLKLSGFVCEVISLSDRYSPFVHEDKSRIPDSALAVYVSEDHAYNNDTGPFQPVKLVVFCDGSWRLQCPIFEFLDVVKGQLSSSSLDELLSLVSCLLSPSHTLCPGLIGIEDVEAKLGYIPKTIRSVAGPVRSLHSISCKVWHVPSRQARKDDSDPRWFRVCGECLRAHSYVQRRIDDKNNTDASKKCQRLSPSSNYPIKYLSPNSKQKRYSKLKNDRLRLKRKVDKFYKKTKIELPDNQSVELCKLVEAIEDSQDGKDELKKISKEGNDFIDKNGNTSGAILEEVWKKDRESFFKDQQRNVTGKRGNRWSLATIRVALAVYTRSPAAFAALHDLNILHLPCSKVLSKILKDGSEKAGIDEEYLQSQHEKFKRYQEQREMTNHPRPLGLGVMMWDEVKVQMKVAWNLKGGGITGFTIAEDELKVLHDVYSSTVVGGAKKASYIIQFLWRDITSGYDLVGPYFPIEASITSSTLQEFVMLCLKAFTAYGFKVAIVLCDGASSNLTVLKILTGYERKELPVNESADNLRDKFFLDVSFPNPEDPYGRPIFTMICPSHQLKNMIAALYSSRPNGSKSFTLEETSFGWETIQKVFRDEMERAEKGNSRKVPGLKYAFVYRDNWTRLNVRPAKIMQQRFMIATIKDLTGQSHEQTAKYLEACNNIFEEGLLSRRRINNLQSPVLANIRKGMEFFEGWCNAHSQKVYTDNSKKSRQRKFLAWQTWDLLRIVVYGFLAFCEWFFTNVSPDGKYFISPLRINGSALESIFSVLKHTSGGNLSALNYGPSLGRFIYRKGQVVVNRNSDTGYRDITLNLDGECFDTSGHLITVKGNRISNDMCQFKFPVEISQSTIGGRQGSNACTLIAVLFGVYCFKENLDISLLWEELPQIWVNSFINAICEGNALYDELYADSAVYLDVEDVVDAAGTECCVQSISPLFGFTHAEQYRELIDHVHQSLTQDRYGVIIGCNRSVGIYLKQNGICALIDSHQDIASNSGAVITIASSFKFAILEYARMLKDVYSLQQLTGTLTWIEYI